ncbi:MAG: phage tail tape measure protein [Ruminococcus bromii]|nr:phage tail tape measure protein [Ruminococcus bromii]
MAYDGSIKIDTKVDTGGFSSGVEKMKSIANKGVSAMTTAFAAVTAGIAAGGTAAATVGSSFEAAMSKVSAISGSTGKDLQSLTDKAKEMGAKTKFSASESAEALQYMAMAGWDTKSMLDGIDGIMSLAAADGLDLATTSDIVTDALTAFGLKASDSTHFADVLAKASSSANTNVSMLGESFKYVAPLAGTMGYSVEDVSVALGLMANASVKGSMAGTSLKTALSNLTSPTEQMAEVMDKYKISISDTNGNALPLIDVLKQLREKFGTLSETEQTAAASTLFGKEAMSGMLAIINASDSDFKNLTENINNADGAAQSMADTMQDNLQGQITILKSALEGLGIEIYEGMQAPLKDAAIEAQGYVNRLTEAFTDGGLTGMIEEAGNIFGELAVKAAEYAPKMVDTAIKFVQSLLTVLQKIPTSLLLLL